MAGDQDQAQKTEQPTPKKLLDASKKGQGATSREVNHLFMLTAGAIMVVGLAPALMGGIVRLARPYLAAPHLMAAGLEDMVSGIGSLVGALFNLVVPMFVIFVIAALATGFAQRGFNISAHSMKPELEKISPLKGLKRMFSMRTVVEFVKGLAKIAIVGAVSASIIIDETDGLEQVVTMSLPQFLAQLHSMVGRLLIAVCAVMAVIAGADFLYQKYEFTKQMKMSMQDIKDEHKQTEGDPLVRARIRQIRTERARQRMIAAVPDADVVVTNPTHFSVALRYDTETMEAPRVVAKGADLIALRMRQVAEEHAVPIVQNPPLARALYAAVEIDREIPVEHYKAVAEVIKYVWRLNGKMGKNKAGTSAR